MMFKAEILLLLASIALFAASAFCFSYATGNFAVGLYPYRSWAIPFVGSGGALMTVASISYSKRKTCL
ncbi:MAG: hypothetical protein NWF05_11795 [Candidatus Bathyarchaeota archaeon]|nr:hypothetical protein [Candidatus Bathyarchaeota archaeon]